MVYKFVVSQRGNTYELDMQNIIRSEFPIPLFGEVFVS